MVNKRFCLYSVSLIQFVNLSKRSSIVNLLVLHQKLTDDDKKILEFRTFLKKSGNS